MLSSVELPVVALNKARYLASAHRTSPRVAAVVAYHISTIGAYIPAHIPAVGTSGIVFSQIDSSLDFVFGVVLALGSACIKLESPVLHPVARTQLLCTDSEKSSRFITVGRYNNYFFFEDWKWHRPFSEVYNILIYFN